MRPLAGDRTFAKPVTMLCYAKSLQSCPTLCDPRDGSPPGSSVPGILQARILEWVAISFSNGWKWKVKVKSLSRARLLATPWTTAYQAPPSMGFSRQEYLSGVPLPFPHDILVSGKKKSRHCLVHIILLNFGKEIFTGVSLDDIFLGLPLGFFVFSNLSTISMYLFYTLKKMVIINKTLKYYLCRKGTICCSPFHPQCQGCTLESP